MKTIQHAFVGTLLCFTFIASGCGVSSDAKPELTTTQESLDSCTCINGFMPGDPCVTGTDCMSGYCASNHVCGIPIDPADTYCGFTATGTDFNKYTCCPSGWVLGTSCEQPTTCMCTGGFTPGQPCAIGSDCASGYCAPTHVCGVPVDPADTHCGFTATGTDFNAYTCCSSGWVPGTTCP
ncbi:hypothetical protein [Vitiosangium sp. GDMCC 1.1324]|uniref:hypothetical protein n=1 Tax=Vitiosangium sp. (strain GDMCC 1.1324) TaxID=2138576 RepID=UPI0011B6E141|nr:hypothetical protein [Vitiosangium sp. GDMCC 1.1324]